ncbi:MAG: hypothetical protein IPL46_29160 [Saprospiraceae bacterium]|nr:hypothetical protein [Saprospiraceae bacterium]
MKTKKDLKRFIEFAYDLYSDDKYFVPELLMAQRDHLNPLKNPYFENARAELFLAFSGDTLVGRIGVVRDENLIRFANDRIGVFGFFEAIDDYKVAFTLLKTAQEWIIKEGLEKMEGPCNFSTNHTAGLLIEGFSFSPSVMMTYNKPYYQVFLERFGLRKKTDLLAYYIDGQNYPEVFKRKYSILEERLASKGITLRCIDMKNFDRDVKGTLAVYNEAWQENLGFVPFTEKEYLHVAKDMKLILNSNLVLLAEKNGEVIGFSLALPDINQVQRTLKRGRLFPFGIFKLLLGKGKIDKVRVIALGVKRQYRKLEIDACFYARSFEYISTHRYLKGGEASWYWKTIRR